MRKRSASIGLALGAAGLAFSSALALGAEQWIVGPQYPTDYRLTLRRD